MRELDVEGEGGDGKRGEGKEMGQPVKGEKEGGGRGKLERGERMSEEVKHRSDVPSGISPPTTC